MNKRLLFAALSYFADFLLVVALFLSAYGALWEYSTRCYLRGFSDAVVPYAASPEKKVEAILNWMSEAPARRDLRPADDSSFSQRDPETTLNYGRLLQVCGTATNAFVNLAASSGVDARRLLLVAPDGTASHVAAEVRLDGRWVVVDPVFHALLRDDAGRLLTRQQLANPAVFREATQEIAGYSPDYSYEHTEHVRLAAIPWIGGPVQKAFSFLDPQWKESLDWTLILERESYAVFASGILIFLLGAVCKILGSRYGQPPPGLLPPPVLAKIWRVLLSPVRYPRYSLPRQTPDDLSGR